MNKSKLTIIGLMNDDEIRWKKIPCKCNHNSVETEYPIFACLHCKCQAQEDLMPRESFEMIIPILDKNNEQTGKTKTIMCNKIKIVRGIKYHDIKGWFNLG
tara:strand:+ start:1067 stop:1369 length:303 start_codon:yes stop_codon:yes gene_type:complete